MENQSGCHIEVLHTDRGGEFVSKEFNLFYEKNGFHRELTTSYTPEQNRVVEQKNRTIVEMARSMLQARGLSKQFLGRSCINFSLFVKSLTKKSYHEQDLI